MFPDDFVVSRCTECQACNRVYVWRLVSAIAVCKRCRTPLGPQTDRLSLEKKFHWVHRNLDLLAGQIRQIDGIGPFKYHRYKVDELFNGPIVSQVVSATQKIGDDIDSWQKAGRLSIVTWAEYQAMREKVRERMIEIQEEILKRSPTAWDIVRTLLTHLAGIILRNLPSTPRKELVGEIAEGVLSRKT